MSRAESIAPLSGDLTVAATRTDEILTAAKAAFVAKGFDGATMQDLARATGMSAGNFYRYFASKDAIIEALVARDLATVEEAFSAIMRSADPRGAMMATLEERLITADCDKDGELWGEIEAAASRREAVGETLARLERLLENNFVRVFARIAGIPPAEASDRFRTEARFVLLLVKSAALRTAQRRRCNAPDEDDAALRRLVLRTVDCLLSEIASSNGSSR